VVSPLILFRLSPFILLGSCNHCSLACFLWSDDFEHPSSNLGWPMTFKNNFRCVHRVLSVKWLSKFLYCNLLFYIIITCIKRRCFARKHVSEGLTLQVDDHGPVRRRGNVYSDEAVFNTSIISSSIWTLYCYIIQASSFGFLHCSFRHPESCDFSSNVGILVSLQLYLQLLISLVSELISWFNLQRPAGDLKTTYFYTSQFWASFLFHYQN
jgi:hypothetical protein